MDYSFLSAAVVFVSDSGKTSFPNVADESSLRLHSHNYYAPIAWIIALRDVAIRQGFLLPPCRVGWIRVVHLSLFC